jgi:hypothetical protein
LFFSLLRITVVLILLYKILMSISIEYDDSSTSFGSPPTPSFPNFPIASQQHLGVVKIGNNIYIDRDGTISLINPVLLPRASASKSGTIRVGSNLTISPDGVLSVDLEQLLRSSYKDFFTDTARLHERGYTLNLLAHKNQTIEPVYVTILNLNLQDSLIFSEVRRKTTGIKLVDNFTANTTLGANIINLNFFGSRTASRLQILRELDLKVGDYITVEGSGIKDAAIQTVSHNTITVDKNATRRVTDARLYYQPRVEASFDITPSGGNTATITLVIENITTNKITLTSPLVKELPAGTKLVFSNTEGNLITIYELIVNNKVSVDSKEIEFTYLSNDPLPFIQGFTSTLGVTKITTTSDLAIDLSGDTGQEEQQYILDISPLDVDLPSDKTLWIGYKSATGWELIGSIKTFLPHLKGSISITFTSPDIVKTTIPQGSVIFFGSFPYNQFYLSMEVDELARLLGTEKYGYDVMLLKNNVSSLLGSGTLDLVENYTDTTYQ